MSKAISSTTEAKAIAEPMFVEFIAVPLSMFFGRKLPSINDIDTALLSQ